jgi:uncharacterized protein (DUF433 family)
MVRLTRGEAMAQPIDIYGGMRPIDIPRYTLPEAAHHLRLPTATVRTWVIGRTYPSASGPRRSKPIIIPADRRTPLFSFGNLAELHVLSAMRKIHGVKLQNIRNAVDCLKKHFHSDHPLIEKQFLTDGKDLFIEQFGDVINVSQQGQMVFQWLRVYLERIDRDSNGKPIRLFPFTANVEQQSPRLVAIDPRINFGTPCISGTDIPTSIIAERFEAGDSLEDLAVDYGRPRIEIEEAVRYEARAA